MADAEAMVAGIMPVLGLDDTGLSLNDKGFEHALAAEQEFYVSGK
jgi:hypothetical protein